MSYKLRIDLKVVKIDEVKEKISKWSSRYMYAHEGIDTENPHVQFYLETQTKSATMRANFRQMGLKGNGAYSLKECDKDPKEYLAYLMKEGRYGFVGFDQVEIDEIAKFNEEVKKEIQEKKEKKKTIIEKVIEYYKENVMLWRDDKNTSKYTDKYFEEEFSKMRIQDWLQVLVRYYKDREILFREFACISQAQTLYLRFNPQAPSELVKNMMSKIEKN